MLMLHIQKTGLQLDTRCEVRHSKGEVMLRLLKRMAYSWSRGAVVTHSKDWSTAGPPGMLRLHIQKNGLQLEQGCSGYSFKSLVYSWRINAKVTHSKDWFTAGEGMSRLHIKKTGLQLE